MTSRVSRSVEHKVNLGNYESVTFKASAELDCDEGKESDTFEALADILHDALLGERRNAEKLAPADSYINDWGW